MTNLLILGANGQVARHVTRLMLDKSDVTLTLYLRRAHRLANPDPSRVTIIEGDVLDAANLRAAMKGQEIIFASLSGDLPKQARAIIAAMQVNKLRRLIFVSSMGIYNEVPGEPYRSILDPYRDSAIEIEKSDLDYTILRPGWFTHERDVNYRVTQKGEAFIGHDVSLNSLADLILKLIKTSDLYSRCSLGVSQIPKG